MIGALQVAVPNTADEEKPLVPLSPASKTDTNRV